LREFKGTKNIKIKIENKCSKESNTSKKIN
jgi:hypothetical protein